MPALDLDLKAFLMELAEKPGVLNCLHRLRRKCFDEIDRGLRKCSRLFAPHDQQAGRPILPEQRRDEDGPVAGAHDEVFYRACGLLAKIRNLDGFLPRQRQADVAFADIDWAPGERRDGRGIHAIGCAQLEFLPLLVENVDRSACGAGELHGLGDDGGQHVFEV